MEDVFAQLARVMNNYYTEDNDPDCCDSRRSF